MNQALSESKVVNTGVPQGCVSSPILTALYTNDCTSSYPSTFIVKFSDGTAILGLTDMDMDISSYTLEVKKDPSHILYSEYKLLPSGKPYRVPSKYHYKSK